MEGADGGQGSTLCESRDGSQKSDRWVKSTTVLQAWDIEDQPSERRQNVSPKDFKALRGMRGSRIDEIKHRSRCLLSPDP